MRNLFEFTGYSPLRVLRALGIKVWVDAISEFEFDATCPMCGEAAGLAEDSAKCKDTTCEFGHSRTVDLLAHHLGGYEKILNRMVSELPEIQDHALFGELPNYIRTAHLRYWLKDQVGKNYGKDIAEGARVMGLVRRSGYNRIVDEEYVKVLTSSALKVLADAGYPVPKLPRAVMPLWTLDAEFAGVAFMDNHPPVSFFPHRALLGGRTGGACLGLTRAIRMTERALCDGAPPLCPIIIPPSPRPTYSTVDVEPPDDQTLLEMGGMQLALPNATIAGVPIDDWLLKEVTSSGNAALSRRACRVLAACEISTSLQFRMEQAFAESGNLAMVREIRNRLADRTLFESGGFKVRVSPHGYLADNSREEIKLTNFTIRMTRNLIFSDISLVYHEAEVEMAGQRWEVVLAGADISHPVKLQTAIRGQSNGSERLPVIISPAKVQSLILPWLRQAVADLPPALGVSNLGWSADRNRFQGAGWMLSADTANEERVIFQPDVEAFRCFSATPIRSAPCAPMEMPQAARDLTAMIAGLICRCYVRSRVRAVEVQNTHPARTLLKMVFAALGQRKPFDMPTNLRTHKYVQGLVGHPFLAFGYNHLQIASCPLPAVFLADTGYAVGDGDYSGVTLTATWIFRAVVSWLLATEGQEFEEKSAFHYATQLQLEGAEAITKAAKLEAWEVSPPVLPILEKAIRSFTAATVGEVCRVDGDSILILSENPGDLLVELLGAGVPAARGKLGVKVSAMQLTPLLFDFFGAAPVYREGSASGSEIESASLETTEGPVTVNGKS